MGGGLALAPLTLWQGWSFPSRSVSAGGWLGVWSTWRCFPRVICYLIFYYALSHIPASRVSAFSYLQPLLATLLGVVAARRAHHGDRWWRAGAVILAGVCLTERG